MMKSNMQKNLEEYIKLRQKTCKSNEEHLRQALLFREINATYGLDNTKNNINSSVK